MTESAASKMVEVLRHHVNALANKQYVVWKSQPFFKAASDTFIIRDGKILAQTFIMVS